MYITIKSLNRNLGKFVEIQDLFIGFPILFLFLILFTIEGLRLFSLIVLVLGLFLLIPLSVANKNRMYKLIYIVLVYLFKHRDYIYIKNYKEEKFESKKIIKN